MDFKKLANIFVEVNEKPKEKVQERPYVASPVTEVKVIDSLNFNIPQSQLINTDQVNQFRNTFRAILEDENTRNFPGNDFFEFWQMKNSMGSIIPQEEIRYVSAFATWNISSKNPQTKDKLLETANTYLGLVEREIESFKKAYESEFNQQVTTNNNLIEQKTKEMAELAERLRLLNVEVDTLKSNNSEKTQGLTQKYESFMRAGNEQKQEILNEITNINQYIK